LFTALNTQEEDVDALREIGITYGQGYFIGKSKPLKDLVIAIKEMVLPLF